MIRFLFLILLGFLPLAYYAQRYRRARRRAIAQGTPLPLFRDGPWLNATLAGLALVAFCFFLLGLHRPSGGNYIAPHVEHGQVVPGRVMP